MCRHTAPSRDEMKREVGSEATTDQSFGVRLDACAPRAQRCPGPQRSVGERRARAGPPDDCSGAHVDYSDGGSTCKRERTAWSTRERMCDACTQLVRNQEQHATKVAGPHVFKALRSITIVPANLKISLGVLFGMLERCEGWHFPGGAESSNVGVQPWL